MPGLGDLPAQLLLRDYYDKRRRGDYRAFLVLPVPCRPRAIEDYRRAGVHISFTREEFLDALFDRLPETEGGLPNFAAADMLLDKRDADPKNVSIRIADDGLRELLTQGIDMLGELLHHYNEEVLALADR